MTFFSTKRNCTTVSAMTIAISTTGTAPACTTARASSSTPVTGACPLLLPLGNTATAMVGDKLASLKATGAKQMVTADCGCMLNITKHAAKEDLDAGRTAPSLPGEHLATFLLRRTGGKQS